MQPAARWSQPLHPDMPARQAAAGCMYPYVPLGTPFGLLAVPPKPYIAFATGRGARAAVAATVRHRNVPLSAPRHQQGRLTSCPICGNALHCKAVSLRLSRAVRHGGPAPSCWAARIHRQLTVAACQTPYISVMGQRRACCMLWERSRFKGRRKRRASPTAGAGHSMNRPCSKRTAPPS